MRALPRSLSALCSLLPTGLATLLIFASGGCADGGSTAPTGDTDESAPRVLALDPSRYETRVRVDREITVLFDRPLDEEELASARFLVNGVPARDVSHRTLGDHGRVTIVPADGLTHHRVIEVEIEAGGDTPLPALTWRFATDPGPKGLLWERADDPAGTDLRTVRQSDFGFVAGGNGGVLLSSSRELAWSARASGIGESGAEQAEDLVWLWDSGRSAALTAAGTIYVGDGLGTWMRRWDPPENLHVRGMWGVTDVLVGSLRNDPDMGFVSSSHPGMVTTTRRGQVLRAASQGFEGGVHYLAVGDEGAIYRSRDRSVWAEVSDRPDWGTFRAVIAGSPSAQPDSQLPPVSVAAGATIAWSEDGTNWQKSSVALDGGPIHALAWDGFPDPTYLAVGEAGTLLRSPDGRDWTSMETGLDLEGETFRAVSAGPWRWIAVGDDGVTVVSPPNALDF